MTAPAFPDALDALRKSLAMAANDPGNVIRADGTKVGYKGDRCMGGWIADAILAGPLAPVLANLQRVTAERDKYRDGEEISDVMAQVGFDRMMEACKERDTATAEAASLRAEVEALKAGRAALANALFYASDARDAARTALARAATAGEGRSDG